MNNEDLLKAVGKIDDKYIEAAEEKRDSFEPRNKSLFMAKRDAARVAKRGNGAGVGEYDESVSAGNYSEGAKRGNGVGVGKEESGKRTGRKFWAQPWFKGACAVAAAFVILVGVGSSGWLLHGMGAAKSADQAAEPEMYYDGGAYNAAYSGTKMEPTEEAVVDYPYVVASDSDKLKAEASINNYAQESRAIREQKLVYNSYLNLQTKNYDEAFAELEKLVKDLDGYFESKSVSNGNFYSSASKSGYCCVRIPTKNYDAFMNAVGQSWHIANKEESISDISQQYYETADRLETLKIKEERLHELLSKADNLSDIIALEDQLSMTEYEIQQMTNVMKGYDNQVDYSTINISIDEVTQMGNTVGSEGFGKRFIRAIKNGITNFAEGVADFIVWIGYNVIEIIIAAVVIFLIIKFHLIRKILNWIKR